jgi:hypothetical protein
MAPRRNLVVWRSCLSIIQEAYQIQSNGLWVCLRAQIVTQQKMGKSGGHITVHGACGPTDTPNRAQNSYKNTKDGNGEMVTRIWAVEVLESRIRCAHDSTSAAKLAPAHDKLVKCVILSRCDARSKIYGTQTPAQIHESLGN